MKTTNEIEALRKRVSELSDELVKAQQELRNAQVALCPVQVGDLVKSEHGTIFKVASIKPTHGKFWVSGFPILKGGEFGKRVVQLYSDWEPV